jgi:hypothetical protein
MQKILFFSMAFNICSLLLSAQNAAVYPIPEFNNEIYFFQKDSAKLLRLEKGNSKMESKTKLGGMENGYALDGERSTRRLNNGNNLSSIFYAGESFSHLTPAADSEIKANGMEPSMLTNMSMMRDLLKRHPCII